MHTGSIRASHSVARSSLSVAMDPSEVTIVTCISKHIARAAGRLQLLFSPSCWGRWGREACAQNPRQGSLGTRPRGVKGRQVSQGEPCQHLSVRPSMSQKGAWTPGTL